MNLSNKLKNTIRFITLGILFFTLTLQIALSSSESLDKTGSLTFISEVPQENSTDKEFAYISGAINNPGIYEINQTSRISDLIALAGGLTEDADDSFVSKEINLAEVLKDQQKVFIPSKNTAQVIDPLIKQNSELININTALIPELTTLPGIGEATAKKIIDARPFSKIEDLLEVSGIGNSKYESIKEMVTVGE